MNIDEFICLLQKIRLAALGQGHDTSELLVLVQESLNDFAPINDAILTDAGVIQPAVVIRVESRY